MDTFILDTVSSGSSQTLLRESMSGCPRLFLGDDLYIYGVNGSLFKVYNLSVLEDIMPAGLFYVSAMTSVVDGTGSNTIAIGPTTLIINELKYQKYPEMGAWSSGSALPRYFFAVDAVSDYEGAISILTGNEHSGTESRVIVSSGVAPYPMSDSGTGIPTTAILTDLEIAE